MDVKPFCNRLSYALAKHFIANGKTTTMTVTTTMATTANKRIELRVAERFLSLFHSFFHSVSFFRVCARHTNPKMNK